MATSRAKNKRDTPPAPSPPEPEPAGGERRTTRPRGRPRLDIDLEAVADVVAELYAVGGINNVSIGQTADRLEVSRATLYRLVRTKNDLLGVLFERSTRELLDAAQAVIALVQDPQETLHGLIRVHIEAAIRMRGYMQVFFGGAGLPPEVYGRWHDFSRSYGDVWQTAVSQAMDDGVLDEDDPELATRLILGMCIWVSRWFRPGDGRTAEDIAEAAFRLICGSAPKKRVTRPTRTSRRKTQ